MKCQHCGKELNQGVKFCDGCGAQNEALVNSVQEIKSDSTIIKNKKRLKAWHIVLIVLGGIFALLGLFFCFILWIGFTFGTVETDTKIQNTTVQSIVESTASLDSFYELDTENTLKNVTYMTPSVFETMGTSDVMYRHINTNQDNVMVAYADLDTDISSLDELDKRVMIDEIVETIGTSDDGYKRNKSVLKTIAGCYGIECKYQDDLAYVHFYAFLHDRGYYLFSYSSKQPITNENEKLFNDIIDTITIKEESFHQEPIVESNTEKENINADKVIFNNKGIKIVYKGVEINDFYTSVNLYIENNSGQDYEFQLRDVSINGYMIDPIFSCEVKNGKKANDSFDIFNSDLEDNNIEQIETIDLSFHAFNWDNDINDFDSEIITIEL